ncbi:hypothetical protein CHUAL_005649 [Chamberlinius hualienensis]
MGSSQSSTSITDQEMQDYLDLTYLNRSEILQLYRRYGSYLSVGEDVRTAAICMEKFISVPELKVNPFKERICKVFSSNGDDTITFEDYLDMMSVFSKSAPTQTKIEYAFRIYDFDKDDMLSADDIKHVVRLLTGDQQMDENGIKLIIDKIFQEADLDGDGKLSYPEFEHAMTKSIDFELTYCIRL